MGQLSPEQMKQIDRYLLMYRTCVEFYINFMYLQNILM